MKAGNSFIAQHFMEEGINTSGKYTRSKRKLSKLTSLKNKVVKDIMAISSDDGTSPEEVATKILLNHIGEIRAYISACGENPNKNPVAAIMQAITLRGMDIGKVAKIMDTTDMDATILIENAEQESLDINDPDGYSILPYYVLGAMQIFIDQLTKQVARTDMNSNLASFYQGCETIARGSGFGNFGVSSERLLYIVGSNQPAGSTSLGSNKMNDNDSPDYFDFNNWFGDASQSETASAAGVSGAVSGGSSSGSSTTWDNILNVIDKVAGAINKVGTSVQNTAGTVSGAVSGIGNKVEDVGSNIGAKSIEKFFKDNWLAVTGTILLLIVIIFIIVYATRRK